MTRSPFRLVLVALLAVLSANAGLASPPPLNRLGATSPHDALLPFDTPYPLGGLVYADRDDTQVFLRDGVTRAFDSADFGFVPDRGLGWDVRGPRRVLDVTRGDDAPGLFVGAEAGLTVSFWVRFRPIIDAPVEGFPAFTPLLGVVNENPDTMGPLFGLLLDVVDGQLRVTPRGADGPELLAVLPAHELRQDGQWHHIALTVQSLCDEFCYLPRSEGSDAPTLIKAYIDGAPAISGDASVYSGLDSVVFGSFIPGFEDRQVGSSYLLDAVFFYDRSLSPSEIQRLRNLESEGLIRQWPQGAPLESPTTYPHKPSIRRADNLYGYFPASELAPSERLDLGAVEPGPSTALVWLEPKNPEPITLSLTSQKDGAPARSAAAILSGVGDEIRVDAGCDGDVRRVATLPYTWHLYALVHGEDGTPTLYVNGVPFPLGCNVPTEAVTYEIHNGAEPGFSANRHVDVAWAATYRGALSADAQLARARPGPYVWSDLVDDQGPREFSGLLGTAWDRPVPPTAPGLFRVRREAPTEAQAIVIPATGPLARVPASTGPNMSNALGPFTLAMTFTPTALTGGWTTVSLARRGAAADPRRTWDVGVDTMCEATSCVYVDVMVPDPESPNRIVTYRVFPDLPMGEEATLVVAWPHTVLTQAPDPRPGVAAPPGQDHRPRIAINGVEFGAAPNLVYRYDFVAPQAPDVEGPLVWHIGAFSSSWTGEFDFRFREARLYAHAVSDLVQVVTPCDEETICAAQFERCIGRPTDIPTVVLYDSASCLFCTDDAFVTARAAATADNARLEAIACEAKRGFRESCIDNAQCVTGLCVMGACTTAQESECQMRCLAEGRSCEQIPVGDVTTSVCGDCVDGFARLPTHETLDAEDPRLRCTWKPTRPAEATCSSDAQCLSGHCVDRTTQAYAMTSTRIDWRRTWEDKVNCGAFGRYEAEACVLTGQQTSTAAPLVGATESVCAAKAPAECRESGRPPIETSEDVLPDGTSASAYACGTDARQCRDNFVASWEVLSPAACQEAWTKAFAYRIEGQCDTITGIDCFGVNLDDGERPRAIYPSWTTDFVTSTNADLGLLAQVFLDKRPGDRLTLADVSALERRGVGRLLIDYLGNPDRRPALESQYGKFLPLGACATNTTDTSHPPLAERAYVKSNALTCLPDRRPNGATCPPVNEGGDGHAFCESRYCARDTKTCEDGTNPLTEVRGNAQNDENGGGQGVKFGIIRCDDTSIEIAENQVVNDPTDDDYRFTADLSQSWNLCMFGGRFPPVPLFEVDFEIDRSQGAQCADNNVRSKLIGIPLSSPPAGPLLGSCQGLTVDADGVCLPDTPGCELPDPTNFSASSLAQLATPVAKLCVPLPEETEDQLEYERTFMAGVVPITVGVGVVLDLCLESYLGMGDNGLPKLEIRPVAAVGAEAKAGVGIDEGPITIWAGAKLELIFASVSLPIGWGFDIDLVIAESDNGPRPVLKLSIGERIALDLEYLSGAMGIFAEIAIGPFGLEWAIELFAWSGIVVTRTLSERTLWETDVDFQFDPGLSLSTGGNSSVCTGRCQ